MVYATPIDDAPTVEVQFGLGPWQQATVNGAAWSFDGIAADGVAQIRASRWFTTSPTLIRAE
ncbi:MAG: hypothetical protein R3320_02240 [Nitriliruptorales bacterium]|nr:hypothetical protein [Nitriliruptorales bacterium]